MNRKDFLKLLGVAGGSVIVLNGCGLFTGKAGNSNPLEKSGTWIQEPINGEDIFGYIQKVTGKFDIDLYRQILGAANEFKEGDRTLNISAADQASRIHARSLLSNTTIGNLRAHLVFEDDLSTLIEQSTSDGPDIDHWTLLELKDYLLNAPEDSIREVMPGLTSDIIACLVKIMDNEELIRLSGKIFNPLPGSKIGSKGYLGARIQPNSPTDNIEDIIWQVFDGWSYAVGDVVLGVNPVSSLPKSVERIEKALLDVITTFGLEKTLPHCVLSHIDVQAEVESEAPGTTGIWFQSLAGTVAANQTFDVTIEKMLDYASQRDGQYGFYAETGQGADLTNGHAEGFDMVIHESRKYGFLRALKYKINEAKGQDNAWVHVNDVAGFIGPEVFRTKEQLVRCCLEDIAMGKLHGLTIGLDICSTLHMDIGLKDLDWCIEQVVPANPAYLMALPTKNDPMLSYLTTAFNNHVRIREQFGYKVNDEMWHFFKQLNIIDESGRPTEHFGDPIWVYAQFLRRKNDRRPLDEIYDEGRAAIQRVEQRGVPIAQGHGKEIWDLPQQLEARVNYLYEDAKVSIWTEWDAAFISSIPAAVPIHTRSSDRQDYVYHPGSGEILSTQSVEQLEALRESWQESPPDIQIVISDGLNVRSLMDTDHLHPFLEGLRKEFTKEGYQVGANNVIITNGRVRAGYACGEILFGRPAQTDSHHGIIHIIGERPGSGHHNFSAYLTVAGSAVWSRTGAVDHDITKVVSGISDTAYTPVEAVADTVSIIKGLSVAF